MDSELLREACEMADMRVCRLGGDAWCVEVSQGLRLYPDRALERAWIESRCADLLVVKAELSFDAYWQTSGRYVVHLTFPENVAGDYWGDTLAESVITAAMAVLGGADNE